MSMTTFTMIGELLEVVKMKDKTVKQRSKYVLNVGVPNNSTDDLIIVPLFITGTEEETKHILPILSLRNWYIFNGIIIFQSDTQAFFKVLSVLPLGVERVDNIDKVKITPNPKYVRKPSQLVVKIKQENSQQNHTHSSNEVDKNEQKG